jgi:hypothetical protein
LKISLLIFYFSIKKKEFFMTPETVWFKRSDGQLFEVTVGSAAWEAMSKAGDFQMIAEDADEIAEDADETFSTLTDDENDSQVNEPAVEQSATEADSGQSGSGKRGRARKGNKADNS